MPENPYGPSPCISFTQNTFKTNLQHALKYQFASVRFAKNKKVLVSFKRKYIYIAESKIY